LTPDLDALQAGVHHVRFDRVRVPAHRVLFGVGFDTATEVALLATTALLASGHFVIVAMFIVTWLAAMLIWRYGQIEEKWTARLQPGTPGGMVREPPAAEGGEPLVIYSVCNNPGGA
jgi:hypothetical protein